MALLDLIVIALYLVLMVLLGQIARKGLQKNKDDFYLPRRFGKSLITLHAFGSGTASDQAVAVASTSFSRGLSGIWYMWLWLFVTPFYWFIAPLLRRLRCTTMGDAYKLRFGASAEKLFAVIGILLLLVKTAMMFKGGGAIAEAVSNGALSSSSAVFLMAFLMLFYGLSGGLAAAVYTDFFQGLLCLLFSFMLLPAILNAIGGIPALHSSFEGTNYLSLVVPGGIDSFYITMFTISGLIGIVAQPHTMSGCASGPTESEGRWGYVCGNLLKRICTCAWALTGVAAYAWYLKNDIPITDESADKVYGTLAKNFLSPGLLGLFLASILASLMSSCDTFMISASALINKNILQEKTTNLMRARISGLAFILSSLFLSFLFSDILSALKVFLKIAPILGISFWMGVFFKSYNKYGLYAATFLGFFTWGLCEKVFQMKDSWQILCYLSSAAIGGYLTSLLFKDPSNRSQMNNLEKLLSTRVQNAQDSSAHLLLEKEKKTTNKNARVFLSSKHFFIPAFSSSSFWVFAGLFCTAFLMIKSFKMLLSLN